MLETNGVMEERLVESFANNENGESNDSIINKCGRWSLGTDATKPPFMDDMGVAVLSENGAMGLVVKGNLQGSMDAEGAQCKKAAGETVACLSTQASELIFKQEQTSTNEFFVFKKRRLDDQTYGKDRINTLSDDVLLTIFQWLPKHVLVRCAQVCHRWKRLAFSECLWRRLDLANKVLAPGVVGHIIHRGCMLLRLAKSEISGPIFSPDIRQEAISGFFQSKLQFLDLSMAAIDVSDLADLLRVCSNLKKLSLEHCTLNMDCCYSISRNPRLNTLNLAMCYGLGGDCLPVIFSNCRKLTQVNIAWVHLDKYAVDRACESLPPSLSHLNISGCRNMLDGHVRCIAQKCPKLQQLDLSDNSSITKTSVTIIIKELPELLYLALSRCRVDLEWYLQLVNMRKLTHLVVHGIFTDSALKIIKESLQHVQVNKEIFSTIARPTVGIRRTSIWQNRVRD